MTVLHLQIVRQEEQALFTGVMPDLEMVVGQFLEAAESARQSAEHQRQNDDDFNSSHSLHLHDCYSPQAAPFLTRSP